VTAHTTHTTSYLKLKQAYDVNSKWARVYVMLINGILKCTINSPAISEPVHPGT
jgi:hypothetical protein